MVCVEVRARKREHVARVLGEQALLRYVEGARDARGALGRADHLTVGGGAREPAERVAVGELREDGLVDQVAHPQHGHE